MKRASEGVLPTIVTRWRADASTVTVWPSEFGDRGKLRFQVTEF